MTDQGLTLAGTLQHPDTPGSGPYPFDDTASFAARDGRVLSARLFTDAKLFPPGTPERVFLSEIRIDGARVHLTLAGDAGVLGSATGTVGDTHVLFRDPYGRSLGLLIVDVAGLNAVAGGDVTMAFAESGLPFTPSAIAPHPHAGVTGLRDAGDRLAAGDVWLVGEDGVTLRYDNNAVHVHLTGDRRFLQRACEQEGEVFTVPESLRGLKLQKGEDPPEDLLPDAYGNVRLQAGSGLSNDTVLRVEPTEHGVHLRILGGFR